VWTAVSIAIRPFVVKNNGTAIAHPIFNTRSLSMRRVWFFAAALIAAVVAFSPASADDKAGWSTLKGQIVFPASKPVPERKKLDVSQDKAHCLSKGDILDESLIVNPKNKGIQNVVVWLRPDSTNPKAKLPESAIFPDDAKRKPATITIDQPCCMFVNRVTVARVGDNIVAKNSAPIAHNFSWSSTNNGEFNPVIAKESEWKLPQPLVAEPSPILFKCTIHPWMAGYVRVFDHPYYAVTDADGKFEIKNAPVGKFRMVIWQEKQGYRGGKEGRFGMPVDIKGPTTELKPIEFDITP
jgi:hypothetical protein